MFPNGEHDVMLLGKGRLRKLYGINPDINTWLSAWVAEVSYSVWRTSTDISEHFPKVIKVSNDLFSFPVLSSKYSVRVILNFDKGIVLVTDIQANE